MRIKKIEAQIFSAIFFLFSIDAFASSIVIRDVRVWDGRADHLSEPTSVVINDNVISAIGEPNYPADAQIISGDGRTLMPGLISSHVHLTHALVDGGVAGLESMTWEDIGARAAAVAREYLMMGFTTVRDMGGMADGFKKAVDEGLLDGPRIYPAGAYISQSGGHGDLRLRSQSNSLLPRASESNLERLNMTRIADGRAEMLSAVRDNFANGAVYIKIHAGGGVASEKDPLHTIQYTPEELKAANQAVGNWGTYWTVHAYTTETVNQALDAGARCIDHAQLIDEETMKRIVREEVFLSTNLAALSDGLMAHPYFGNPKNPSHHKFKLFLEGSRKFVGLVNEYQPKWVFGDDFALSSRPFMRQHIDFEKWYAGHLFGNLFALRGMTSTAGELAALTGPLNPYPKKLGVIEVGAYADLLIVDGNPLRDLGAIGARQGWFDAPHRDQNIESIRLIMKDGSIFKNTL